MAFFGITAGLMVTPLTTGVLNSVDTEDSGLASGINHAVSRIGNLISVALCGAALALRYQQHLSDSLSEGVVNEEARAQIEPVLHAASGVLAQVDLSDLPEELQVSTQQLVTKSLDNAFTEVMLAASLFALLAACSAAALRYICERHLISTVDLVLAVVFGVTHDQVNVHCYLWNQIKLVSRYFIRLRTSSGSGL